MRDNGYTYKEISAALTAQYGQRPSIFTVRDWTGYFCRVIA